MARTHEPRALTRYLSDIRGRPLSTRERERELSEKYRQDGCTTARDELVEANLGYVVQVALEYRDRGLAVEDLISEGNVGLIEAARRFDASRETKFITYATWWIRKAILAALERQVRVVKVPTYQMKKAREVREAFEALRRSLGRDPDREELSRYLGRRLHTMDRLLQYGQREASLEDPLENGTVLGERLADAAMPSPEECALGVELRTFVETALRRLPARERRVIKSRYGIPHGRRMTLREIGDRMSLSRERVRQIERSARARLCRLYARLMRPASRGRQP